MVRRKNTQCWFCKAEAKRQGEEFRKAFPVRHKIQVHKEAPGRSTQNAWFRVYDRDTLLWCGQACCLAAAKMKAFQKALSSVS
jgi:hypothetical protein